MPLQAFPLVPVRERRCWRWHWRAGHRHLQGRVRTDLGSL